MAETQTMSELDRIMQTYINSGQYSESELAEIRKREANKLKNTRETSWWRGEEGLIPDELQPGVSRPKVSKKEVEPTVIKNEEEKAAVQKPGLKHIKPEDLRGKDATFWESMWTSEQDVYDNLKEHYKDQGVRFEQVGGFSDQIWVKNRAGQKQTFQLPSLWNKNKGVIGAIARTSDVLTGTSEQEFDDWESFHKGITDFIEEGNKNIDPELAQQQTDARRDLAEILNNDDAIREIVPDWDGNWEAALIDDDKEKKDLTKALMKNFGEGGVGPLGKNANWRFRFDEEWDKLDEEDIEFAIEDIISLKATEQKERNADVKRKLKNYYLGFS